MSINCNCKLQHRSHKRIVITGGPGAGKTALLEIARKKFCEHVAIVPEAATIIFGGGFWRYDTLPAKQAAQRAIYHVQHEMERMVEEEGKFAIALCDRGTVDGLAYWPGEENNFWEDIHTKKAHEINRYDVVIHLRTPSNAHGYNNVNPVRIESAQQALEIDKRIVDAWKEHPRRFIIESGSDFLIKVEQAMSLILKEIPDCCKQNN